MKVVFNGDFSALAEFESAVRKVPKSMRVVSEQLAEETIELIREGFEKHADPYGKPWKDLVLREGQPLEDTGGMKGAWYRRRATRQRFVVANAKSYSIFHQKGTGLYGNKRRRIRPIRATALRVPVRGGGTHYFASVRGTPKRRMVPESGRLPPRWKRRYVETSREVLTELFR